jgi:hypothetical protein
VGYQWTISADTPEELSTRIVGFYQAIKAASDALFPVAPCGPVAEPAEVPEQPKRRAPRKSAPVIEAAAEAIAEVSVEAIAASTIDVSEPTPMTKKEFDNYLPAWNSEMKMIPAAVAAAQHWLTENNTGDKAVEIYKLDPVKDGARLLVMQLLQVVGVERMSLIPEDKYADVVAFVEAQRAQFA